jgi:predicted secreted protein
LQNFPNPFNPTTEISWQLAVSSPVRLAVYDLAGQEIAILINETKTAGIHQITFDGSNLASGIYLYHLQAGQFVETKKMILLK